MSNEEIQLGLFDIDGTTREDGGDVPSQVTNGLRRLQNIGVRTSVMTGQGIARLQMSINTGEIISPTTPVGLENGGRIYSPDSQRNIQVFPLTPDEYVEVLRQIQDGDVEFLAYYPQSEIGRGVVWTSRRELAEDLARRYGNLSDVIVCPLSQLEARMRMEKPCMLTIKPFSGELVELFTGLNATTNGTLINISTVGVNKATGVLAIAEILGIPIEKVLVAGNDRNDLCMLQLPVGARIVVGDTINAEEIDQVVFRCADPKALGVFLETLVDKNARGKN